MKSNLIRLQMSGLIIIIFLVGACAPAPAARAPAIPTATIQSTSTAAPIKPPRTPVIIDSDMSLDGIMAILYLLQRPEFSIKAITVTGDGEAHCAPGSEHALGLVAMVGAKDIPVACGRETPLSGNHEFPAGFRKAVDGSMGVTWPKVVPASKLTAVELIQKTLQEASQPVVIVTDGPLTNLGEVFQKYPQLVKQVQMIYIMGGSINTPGNLYDIPAADTNKTAEFNIFIDPHAANLVLQSAAPITLVPLDITNLVPLNQVFFNLLTEHKTTPAAQAVYAMLEYTRSYQQSGMYFWDPLTYAIASDNSLAQYVTRKITVVEGEGREAGRTKVSEAGQEVRVALSTNPDRFMEVYLSTLNGGQKLAIDWEKAKITPTPMPPALTVTYAAGKCIGDGTKQIPPGMTGFKLVNKDPVKGSGLAVLTINADKTFADLDAYSSVDPPPWAQVLSFGEAEAGKEINLQADVKKGQIYLVCFDGPPPTKIGVLGPIEVK